MVTDPPLFFPSQKWQEKAQEAKKKYEEDMKAYKAKKANEPDDKSEEESKPKKKGAVKEFMDKKKENNKKKTSSPRKSGDSQKFKSAEFVETDDSSSENEGDVSYTTFICNSFASASPALQTYFRLSVLVFFHEEKRQTTNGNTCVMQASFSPVSKKPWVELPFVKLKQQPPSFSNLNSATNTLSIDLIG